MGLGSIGWSGSEAGGGGGGPTKLYTHLLQFVKNLLKFEKNIYSAVYWVILDCIWWYLYCHTIFLWFVKIIKTINRIVMNLLNRLTASIASFSLISIFFGRHFSKIVISKWFVNQIVKTLQLLWWFWLYWNAVQS